MYLIKISDQTLEWENKDYIKYKLFNDFMLWFHYRSKQEVALEEIHTEQTISYKKKWCNNVYQSTQS